MAADHTTRTRCHVYGRDATRGRLSQCGVETLASLGEGDHILGLKIHRSLIHAGKIRGQTSKADKQEGEEEEMEDVLSHAAKAV